MKKKIAIYFTMLGIVIGCAGCGNNAPDNNKANQLVVDSNKDVSETGSFSSMDITYKDKYKIEFTTQSTGHPEPGIDFNTGMGWKNEKGHGSCSISYYVKSDNSIEADYEGYSELEEVTVADKTYKIIREVGKVILLYKLDDSFYIAVEVFEMSQYDENGNSVDVTYTVSDLLDDGCLDEEIVMNIIELE